MFGSLGGWNGSPSNLDYDLVGYEREREFAKPRGPSYLIGLSIGQGPQPTGMAILERTKAQREGARARYVCCYLERIPPHTTYPVLVERLEKILARPPLSRSPLLVEAGTSVHTVVRYLRQNRLNARIHPFEVMASGKPSKFDGVQKVSKGDLIETARQVIQDGRLAFDKMSARSTTPRPHIILQALSSYSFNRTAAANEAFASRDGEYDDLVLAVALACWFGERRQREFAMIF